MSVLTGLTRGGKAWTPQFVQDIDLSRCIGCGRCFKVCGRDVFLLRGLNEDDEFVDEDEDDDDIERKVMTVAQPENCVGCEACTRVCPKNCHIHSPLDVN